MYSLENGACFWYICIVKGTYVKGQCSLYVV